MIKRFVQSSLLTLISVACVLAQNPLSAEQRAEELRGQLRAVIDREAELQTRLQQLEEDLKPENIQRSIALIGTTRPEDLREQRRQQLEKEKTGVSEQLEQLATSRARLETSISSAEAEADPERTQVSTPALPTQAGTSGASETATAPVVTTQKRKTVRARKRQRRHKTRRRVSRPR